MPHLAALLADPKCEMRQRRSAQYFRLYTPLRCSPPASADESGRHGSMAALPLFRQPDVNRGGGEGGIRTHERACGPLRDFQSRPLGQLGHLSGELSISSAFRAVKESPSSGCERDRRGKAVRRCTSPLCANTPPPHGGCRGQADVLSCGWGQRLMPERSRDGRRDRFADRARRGASGALYPQSAIAGSNSCPRPPVWGSGRRKW